MRLFSPQLAALVMTAVLIAGCDSARGGSGIGPPDHRPVAGFSVSPGTTVLVPAALTFDAGSTLPAGDNDPIELYLWQFGDGGIALRENADPFEYVYTSVGTYAVQLTVTTASGLSDSAAAAVRVHRRPVADAGANRSVRAGDAVQFDGGASFDPDEADNDGYISAYQWDFDYDGDEFKTGATGVAPDWTYAEEGSYVVALRVRDNDDVYSAIDSVTVTVVGPSDRLPPIADIGGPYGPALVGTTVPFDAGGSMAGDGVIASYEWDFDYDGAELTVGATEGPTTEYAYHAAGTYTVALRVTDDNAPPLSNIDTVQLIIHEPPVAQIELVTDEYGMFVGNAIVFDGSESDDDGYIVKYVWNFGDGSGTVSSLVPTISHTFESAGDYNVHLEVEDNYGAVSGTSAQLSITIGERPTIEIEID